MFNKSTNFVTWIFYVTGGWKGNVLGRNKMNWGGGGFFITLVF